MDAQGTMRLMFDTMDAYDRADFDRLAEIYAEDAQWLNANPDGPHCHSRDDIFNMFRAGWPMAPASGSMSCAPPRARSW